MNLDRAISAAVIRVLHPLVRILLRNGIPYGAFADLAKSVYVEVAADEFGIPGRKQSDSRVSVITGLTRKEVRRVKELPPADDGGAAERYNRAARVVGGWVRDARYADAAGQPAVLPIEGDGPTFSELVKRFSGDVPARAVLDELVRVGVAKPIGEGRIQLQSRSYVPKAGEVEKIGILGTDVSALISTIDHNLRPDATEPFFQRKVSYDNLPEEAIPQVRMVARERSQELIELLDRYLSERDRDVNPEVRGTGRKVAGVGIYYFEGDGPAEGTGESHGR